RSSPARLVPRVALALLADHGREVLLESRDPPVVGPERLSHGLERLLELLARAAEVAHVLEQHAEVVAPDRHRVVVRAIRGLADLERAREVPARLLEVPPRGLGPPLAPIRLGELLEHAGQVAQERRDVRVLRPVRGLADLERALQVLARALE